MAVGDGHDPPSPPTQSSDYLMIMVSTSYKQGSADSVDEPKTHPTSSVPLILPPPRATVASPYHHSHILPSSPPLHKIFVSWIANLLPRAWVLQPTPQPYYFSLHYKIWSLWRCANRSSLSWWMQRRLIRVGKSSALHRFAGDTTTLFDQYRQVSIMWMCAFIVYFAINQQ